MSKNNWKLKKAAEEAQVSVRAIRRWIDVGLLVFNEKGEKVRKKLFAIRVGRDYQLNPTTFETYVRDVARLA